MAKKLIYKVVEKVEKIAPVWSLMVRHQYPQLEPGNPFKRLTLSGLGGIECVWEIVEVDLINGLKVPSEPLESVDSVAEGQ